MSRLAIWTTTVMLITLAWVLSPQPAASQGAAASVTAAGGGIFPSGTSYNGVPLSGLHLGMGIDIPGDGTASGDFETTLLGTSLGSPRVITVQGKASTGSRNASGNATFSGTCSVDMGDGTPPLPGVPLTVTAAVATDGTKTLTLVLGTTTLPTATINLGILTIQ